MGHVHSGVGRHHPQVLVVDGGVVGGAGVVVVVVPCCHGVWVFLVLKVTIDVAHAQTVHTTSVILWWHRLLGTTTSLWLMSLLLWSAVVWWLWWLWLLVMRSVM